MIRGVYIVYIVLQACIAIFNASLYKYVHFGAFEECIISRYL